jgi:hypothetical protein
MSLLKRHLNRKEVFAKKMLNDISEITPHLFLTSGIAVTENNLRRHKVKLVINVARELPVCPLGDDVRVVKIALADKYREDLYKYFEVSLILLIFLEDKMTNSISRRCQRSFTMP